MRWFAEKQGEDADYWGIVGLLHDIDFELYPEEHCQKAPELLQEAGVPEAMIHSIRPMAMASAPISSPNTSWKRFCLLLMQRLRPHWRGRTHASIEKCHGYEAFQSA